MIVSIESDVRKPQNRRTPLCIPRPLLHPLPYPTTSVNTRKTRKENTAPKTNPYPIIPPLSLSTTNSTNATMPESTQTSTSRKRKLSLSAATHEQEHTHSGSTATPSNKKQRTKAGNADAHTSGQTPIFQVSRLAIAPEALGMGVNPSEEFPNGSVYCHQCCQRRDALGESVSFPANEGKE